IPKNFTKSGKQTVKEGEVTVYINGGVYLKAKYKIDPTKTPKTIDYMLTDGQGKGMTSLGIYELNEENDTLKCCFAFPGKDRPEEFSSRKGSQRTLTTWRKVIMKKDDDN